MSETTTQSARLPPRFIIRAAWSIHRKLYSWSGGRFGLSDPKPGKYGLARLTTTGRRSGELRSVMIGYFLDGDDLITMAMNGWGAPEPAWWLNLQDTPEATLDLKSGTIPVTGRAATDDEHDRLWDRWRELDPKLDAWAARRPTKTAVVILTPDPPSLGQ
jgi:deazaflavin-dependent oxidoreductase (nitroreductase family)